MQAKSKSNKPPVQASLIINDGPVTTAEGMQIPRWMPLAIVVLTAVVYLKSVSNNLTNFDDDFYINKNPFLRDLSAKGIASIFTSFYNGNYHPFTTLTYLFEFNFFGEAPMIYHLVNVLLHLGCVFAVYKFTEQLTGKAFVAAVVSVLFALHPMHVESVAWVSERKDVMYGLFYVLALRSYLSFIESPAFNAKKYVAVVALFIAALFSKSAAVTFPLVLLAIDYYKGRQFNSKLLLEKVPLLLLSLVMGIVNIKAQESAGAIISLPYSIMNNIFIFTSGPAFYIFRLFVPFQLSLLHGFPAVHDGLLPVQYYLSLPFLLLVVFLGIRKAGHYRKVVIFGLLFFIICLSVMLQLIPVGAAFASERYTYIAYIGLFLIMGELLYGALASKYRQHYLTAFAAFVALCCVLTFNRIGVWKDSEVLLTDLINSNQDVADISYYYWLRGTDRVANGQVKGAVADFSQAISQKPDFAEAYDNRAVAFAQTGNVEGAIQDFTKAAAINPANPQPFYNRASLKASTGNFPGALEDYTAFLSRAPRNGKAYVDRGMVKLSMQDTSGACEDWNKATTFGNDEGVPFMQQFCK